MAFKREVWIGQEATVSVWEQDISGNILTPAIREFDFAQEIVVTPIRHKVDQEQPGVANKEVRSTIVGYEIRISELYQRADQQMTPFEDETKQFRLLIECVNEKYLALHPEYNETRDIRLCRVVDGPNERWRDNDVTAWDLTLQGEYKV